MQLYLADNLIDAYDVDIGNAGDQRVYLASEVEGKLVDQALRIKELEAGAGLSLQQAKEMQALRDRITKLERALQTLAACNLHEGNCASLEIATKRIRRLAAEALSTAI